MKGGEYAGTYASIELPVGEHKITATLRVFWPSTATEREINDAIDRAAASVSANVERRIYSHA